MTGLTSIQWNARGLTWCRLEVFRNFLSLKKPSVVLLCETFLKNTFSVKLRSYNIINENPTDRPGGEVALLVHNSISDSILYIKTTPRIEVVGISIRSSSSQHTARTGTAQRKKSSR